MTYEHAEKYAGDLPTGRRTRPETLHQLIYRLCTDAQAVGAEMTPELLAKAILDAGYRKLHSKVNTQRGGTT